MQAVILAAGESSRFWPLNKQHKSMMSFFGRPLIYWTIKGLAQKDFKDIIIVVNPASTLENDVAYMAKELGVKLSFVEQEKPLGTGDAVYRTKDMIKGPFMIVWPYKVNIAGIIDKVMEKEKGSNKPMLVCGQTESPSDFGMLKFEGDRVVEIVENPTEGNEPSKVKVSGTYFLDSDFFGYYESLTKHHPEDLIDALNLYMKAKEVLFVVMEDFLPSLKYPWDMLKLSKFMFRGEFNSYIAPSATVGRNALISNDVYIGENVVIGDNTIISNDCYIGDNCKIGPNNVLRGPVVLEKSVVAGAFTEIKNTIVQEGTHFHSGYIGDSVIGKNCRFGAGFITANRRIDRNNIKSLVKGNKVDTGLTYLGVMAGENVKFGIHAGTMPGVIIGNDCLVGPGTLVFENLEDKTTFYTEPHNHKEVRKE